MNPALYRPGTSDANIWASVVDGNEYRLPDRFESSDVILDIGGNTGAFTHACIQRGAGKVIAFEPDPDNYILFRKQMKAELKDGRVEVFPLAVVGGSGFEWRTFSGVVKKDGEINHGGAYTFNRDGSDPLGYGEYFVGNSFRVPCIGVGMVMDMAPAARLWKLDCEHAEFEIIQSIFRSPGDPSRMPSQIIGEYHPAGVNTVEDLVRDLDYIGYKTDVNPHPNSDLGLFFATRK